MTDRDYMERALRLSARGLGTTAPNPSVGCVLVRDGSIVGEGYTAPAGGPHGEIKALAEAGANAAGATAYVTLEPCCHTGRTGPCTTALINARVARVVCAVLDPNPLVKGQGVAVLREAGITVEVGLLVDEAVAINRGFFSRMQRGRPWVRSKLAASLDGRTALANGESKWITGEEARRDTHRFRARSGAILTGIGTVLADDPSLTARVRGRPSSSRQPLRAIVDARLDTPAAARILTLPGEVVIFTTHSRARATQQEFPSQVRICEVAGTQRCDLADVLKCLADLEINDVWVEAGARLNGALLDAGLIDELIVYFAPQLLGDTARGMFAMTPLKLLAARPELAIDEVRRVGRDLRIRARPVRRSTRDGEAEA